ncbi:hypothetical protein [Enterocloster sp.]
MKLVKTNPCWFIGQISLITGRRRVRRSLYGTGRTLWERKEV